MGIELLDIPYKTANAHNLQKLDLYLPSPPSDSLPSLFVFVHGGAWRTGDRKEHAQLGRTLAGKSIAVAIIDYRLSVKVNKSSKDATSERDAVHPDHVNDFYDALEYLLIKRPQEQGGAIEYDAKTVVLAGHSVGAWMVASVCFPPLNDVSNSMYKMPTLNNGDLIRESIVSWILLDGIYDIPALLDEYGNDYNDFVQQAFAHDGSYSSPEAFQQVSISNWELAQSYANSKKYPHVYILHSPDDELLSFNQSLLAMTQIITVTDRLSLDHLPRQRVQYSEAVSYTQIPPLLNVDFSTLTGSHDGMLQKEEFYSYMAKIVEQETAN